MTDDNTAVGAPADDGIEVETLNSEAAVEELAAPEDTDTSDPSSEKKKNPHARQRDKLRAEVQVRDQRIAELEAKLNPKPVEQPSKGRPDIKDFTDVLEYMKADSEWLADNKATEKLEAFKKAQKEEAENSANQKVYQEKSDAFTERADALLDKVPDFYERAQALYEEGMVTPAIENAVLDSPVGEMVALYLMANPNDLAQIVKLNEVQTYRAIALIEAKIGQAEPTVAAKKTNAAAPITPIGKKAVTSTKSPADMSQEEYEAHAAKLTPRR